MRLTEPYAKKNIYPTLQPYDTQKNTVNINDREELKKLHTNDDMRNK